MRTGLIGLGIMGRPMALNLLKAGYEVVIPDVDRGAAKEVAAAGAARASYEEIGKTCERIILMLPNGKVSKEVLFGEQGIAPFLKEGSIVCDMGSVAPSESRYCYDRLKAIGVGFVDAPVSGGEPGAIGATMAIMAGGDQADYEAMRPLFDVLGGSACLVGPSGSGSIAKLANQMIVNNTVAVVSEAFVLAAKAGADPEKVFEAIRGGLAGSAVLEMKIPKILARDFEPGGTITVIHKDLKNILDTAHETEVPVPYSAQLFEILQTLKIHGHAGDDQAGIVRYFERLADAEVRRTDLHADNRDD